ncbi:MAG: thioesterase family protein [Parvibaculaceae bacterium]
MPGWCPIYQSGIDPAWVDYNGHMSDYAYGILFSRACEAFLRRHDISRDYLARTQHSLYLVESKTDFLVETKGIETIEIDAVVAAVDTKRLRLLLAMRGAGGSTKAVAAMCLLHVRKAPGAPPSGAPFADDLRGRLTDLVVDPDTIPLPPAYVRRSRRSAPAA